MNAPKLIEIENLRKTEPIEILKIIDKIPIEFKKSFFPNFVEFYKSNPKDLTPLIEHGIRSSPIIGVRKIKNDEYNMLKNSKILECHCSSLYPK